LKHAKCQELRTDSKIKVEEKGKKIIFRNQDRKQFIVTQVDGCVVCNEVAADYVVTKIGAGTVAVELKGCDAAYGAHQIFKTAGFFLENDVGNIKVSAGIVVCGGYPRVRSKIQILQQRFMKLHKGPLHIISRNIECDFERALGFDFP